MVVIDGKEKKEKADLVQVGSKVTIREGGGGPETYFIVGAAEANPREGKISNESPIGKAILDHRAGDEVSVDAPGGTFKVRIVKVEWGWGHPFPGPVHQDRMRKAFFIFSARSM